MNLSCYLLYYRVALPGGVARRAIIETRRAIIERRGTPRLYGHFPFSIVNAQFLFARPDYLLDRLYPQ